jgi:lysophospholipase L1-like esterase
MRTWRVVPICLAVLLAVSGQTPTAPAAALALDEHWVAAWSTAPQGPYPTGFTIAQPILTFAFPDDEARNQTFRLIVRPSIGGDTLRLRLSNTFGTQPVTFGVVFVGLQAPGQGANLVSGSNHVVTFGGQTSVTIPVGQEIYSDPLQFKIDDDAGQPRNLAVSLFVPGLSGPMTWHAAAFETSYISNPRAGNHARDVGDSAFLYSTTSWFWLDGVEVRRGGDTAALVALGDSITDGFFSTLNENDRWPDDLARQLQQRSRGGRWSVVNEGIGGNMVTRLQRIQGGCTPCDGPPLLDRLDRDVFGQAGVESIILLEGINDLGGAGATADQVIAGMREVIGRVHDHDLTIIGATITPSTGTAFNLYGTAETNARRMQVNQFIRTSGEFDGVVDFDAAVRDPSHPEQLLPAFDANSTVGGAGDHLHPNRAGFQAMARTVAPGFVDRVQRQRAVPK